MAMLCKSIMGMKPTLRILCSSQVRAISHYGVKTVKPLEVKSERKKARKYDANRQFLGMDGSFEENYKRLEDLEEEAESMGLMDLKPERDDPVINKSISQLEKRVEKAMIRRKYFRPEPEVNLLTWDAKAQMRYLHATDPDTWTADQLAQSFPISAQGARKIVTTHWAPRSLQELIRHDERVHKNWLALKACGESGNTEGPLYNRYQRLVEEGKLYLLGHATGIRSLPQPEQKLLPAAGSVVEPVEGRFTAIVKGYCDRKSKEQSQELPKVSDRKQLQDRNIKLIDSVVKSSLGEKEAAAVEAKLKATYSKATLKGKIPLKELSDGEDETPPEKAVVLAERASRRRGRPLRVRREDTEDTELDIDHEMPRLRRLRRKCDTRIQLSQFLGAENEFPMAQSGYISAGELKDKQEPKNEILLSDTEKDELGIKGTGKVTPGSDKKLPGNFSDMDSIKHELGIEETVQKFKRNSDADNFFQKLQYETVGEETEVYMYEEGKGYKYPFGRRGDIPENLEKVPEVDEATRVYRKNNVVYDEDGEFLFRTPCK